MESISENLMSALPLLLVVASIFGVGFLAVRADGRGGPRPNANSLSRLEERVEALEQQRR